LTLSRANSSESSNIESLARSADIPVPGDVSDQHVVFPSSAGTTSPSPIGWERAGVRARVHGKEATKAHSENSNYALDLEEFSRVASRNYDLIVLVNPNSPTGQHVPRAQLERALQAVPTSTRIWVDETYIEYA